MVTSLFPRSLPRKLQWSPILASLSRTSWAMMFSTTPSHAKQPVLAIRREESSVWERRAPLNPHQVQNVIQSGVKVLIQPSARRAYTMPEYKAAGAIFTDDLSEADCIVGVKQVPIEHLLEDKTYIFFSHTIKAQPENMPLLDAMLQKRIRFIDYERILDDQGVRLVAFGKSAGISGMINILHGLGLRLLALGHHTPFMHVGSAHNYSTSSAAKAAIAIVGREIQYGLLSPSIGPIVFTFTGSGNVSQGAQEIIQELPHEYVSPNDLKEVCETGDMRKVFVTVVHRHHHLVRKDRAQYNKEDFQAHPEQYTSVFAEKIAPYTTCLVNGVFWAPGTSRLLTIEQCKQLLPEHFDACQLRYEGVPKLPQKLLAVADISCDLNGSLEFMTQCTTIDNPFLLYDAHTNTMSHETSGRGVVVMSIDNLPAQLPREATDYFGSLLLPFIEDSLKLDGKKQLEEYEDVSRALKDAVIVYNGLLMEKYKYIEELRRKNEDSPK